MSSLPTELVSDGASQSRVAAGENAKKGLISVLSILGAIGASACCVIPFVLFAAGISGAWIGNLTALAPYKPYFVAGTLALLGLGFYMVYRRPAVTACADGSYCARPAAHRIAKTGLWTATVLVLLAITFSYWFPLVIAT
mgnify:CR=1 FL=1